MGLGYMVSLAMWAIFGWSIIGSYIVKLVGDMVFPSMWFSFGGQNHGPYIQNAVY